MWWVGVEKRGIATDEEMGVVGWEYGFRVGS
jgi:hypothetical protein